MNNHFDLDNKDVMILSIIPLYRYNNDGKWKRAQIWYTTNFWYTNNSIYYDYAPTFLVPLTFYHCLQTGKKTVSGIDIHASLGSSKTPQQITMGAFFSDAESNRSKKNNNSIYSAHIQFMDAPWLEFSLSRACIHTFFINCNSFRFNCILG